MGTHSVADETTPLRYATYVRVAQQEGSSLELIEAILVGHGEEWAGGEPVRRYREAVPHRMSSGMLQQIVADAARYGFGTLLVATPNRLARVRPRELVTQLGNGGVSVRFADGFDPTRLRLTELVDAWLDGTE